MKKYLILIILAVSIVSSFASNRYWVGGTGDWNDNAHWSLTSGGEGGAAIPTSNDDVIFDQHSFSSARQTVMLTSDAICHTMDWSKIDDQAVFSCAATKKLTVTGSYVLSSLLLNGFKGQTIFAAASIGNTISTSGKIIIGNWIFNGSGSWVLTEEVTTEEQVSISLLKGSLSTNNKKVTCGSFIGNSTEPRSLNLLGSEIIIKDTWDFSSVAQLNFNSGTSRIIFENTLDDDHFKSGGLAYNSVSPQTTFCSPSGTPCVPDLVITLSGTNVTCNNKANGSATVVSVTGGTGTYTYLWNPGAFTTQTIAGLIPGTYTVRVTDTGTGSFCFCSIQITEPGVLFDYELYTTQPTCNAFCNGEAAVDATGGTFPYTYLWSPVGGTNDTASNLCADTYTIVVTDANGCTANTTVVLGQPSTLVAPGSSTNITCTGNCDGTVSVTPSGGTSPYTYLWNTGATTSGLTGRCPATYSVTVTDFKGCTVSYSATITQPAVLTLSATKTNASCGGTCDGTATASVSGGTTPYTYAWTTGSTVTTPATSNVVSNLCAATYTVIVTDANGCSQSTSVIITEPPVLIVTAGGTNTSCFNSCDGSATATISGGTSPFAYVWSTGASTATPLLTNTINTLCAGVDTVTVTDANGCSATTNISITEPALLVANPTATNVSCFGLCDGTATVTPTGGTSPYVYSWNTIPVKTTATITNLCPGTYSVTVTDSNGCDTIQSITITQPTQVNANVSGTNLSCNAVCNGTTTVTPSGGSSPYTYLWNTGETTSGLTGRCAGTYSVIVTDNNGCSTTASVTLTQPNLLTVTILSTTLACNGDCNATATATVAGGTPVYGYLWAPGGATTSSISNQCAGTYTLTVTDINGCTATRSVIITQPTALTLTSPLPKTNASCFSVCDGVVAALAGGGTPTYSYSWAPGGQTTSSINNQCAGTYTVTLRDANGCTLMDTISIIQPAPLSANPSVTSNLNCSGICIGSAISNPTGGTAPFTYSWAPGGQTTASVANLCAGTYNVTVRDLNSCSSTMPVTITQPPVLSAPISGSTSSCTTCTGTATVAPAGGVGPTYTYLWNPGGQTTQTAIGLCPNSSYTVTVTDMNGCTATSSVIILQTITINITTSNSVLSCSGACDGVVTANASGGIAPYDFVWTKEPGATIISLTQTASNLCAGTYVITVLDSIGCNNKDTVTFTDPPVLLVNTTNTNVVCNGVCNGTATATPTGGTGAYTYSWNSSPVQTTQIATALCAGTYVVTVADASGCTNSAQATITEPTAVSDNLVNIDSANCNLSDGTITIAPTGGTGGYSYNWGPGTPTGDGTPSISNLSAGIYTLTITDGAGCTFGFTYLVNNIAGPTLAISHTNETCNNSCNGTATVTATGGAGGYLYNWTPGSPTGDGTNAITSLCGTTLYTIQVTDALGCINLDTATVINPTLISPNPTIANESCGGTCDGSISLAPTGGFAPYTYLWAPNLETTSTITNLCAATYTVTVTDANGCDSILVISIVSPPTLTATLSSTNVLCNGDCDGTATVVATGGTGAGTYTYSWSHGPFVLSNVVNLCPGQYTVTVIDGNLCTAKDSVIITEPLVLTAATSQVNISCNGLCDGIAIVSASGGTLPYSYLWNPGSIANDSASNLCVGSYNATVTDFNGCVVTPSAVVITQSTAIVPNATFVNPNCNGACDGTATVTPTGGNPPYTYLWMPGSLTTQNASNLCAGSYTVTVRDASACTNNQIVTLVDPAVLNANTSATPPSCANGCNGTVTSSPVGGTATYTYSWSPIVSTDQTITNLCPATYTVIVTDTKNCTNSQTVVVTNPLPIDAIIGTTQANCGICDGTITITPTTGTPSYTYLWSPAPTIGQGTSFGDSVCLGTYNITVTDFNGCDSTFSVVMNNSNGPTSETVSVTNVTCNSVCNGSGSVAPIGGLPPYTYLWNDVPGTTNDTATGLCAGSYLVEVTDANGCVRFSPVTITEPTPIVVNGTITDAICNGVCTGAITITSSGGTGAHTYNWAPVPAVGQGTTSVSGLCAGTYTLTTTDASLCTKSSTFTVGQTAPLIATISSTFITCFSNCDGMAYVTVTAGSSPYAMQWDDPLGQVNDTATALCAGTYNVDITDANGCISTLTTTLTAPSAVTANPTITNAACGLCDGQVILAPTGGTGAYTYLWSNAQTNSTATALCAGLYSVDITDVAGCVTNVSIPVSNTSGPISATITSTNASCFGVCDGTVTGVTPIGGTSPYTYLWIQTGQTTVALSNLCAGVHYIQITDALGCSLTDSVTITEPSQIIANDTITAATCNVCDGSITIAPSGGVAPYTVLWNTGSTALTLTNLCAGVYSVRITASNGCFEDVVIPLSSQGGPTLLTSSTNISCNGFCNGSASVTATGGMAPYDYLWNDASLQTTSTATLLCAGTYFVQVTDVNNCVSVSSVTITSPTAIGFSTTNITNPLCPADSNGSVTTLPSGGTLPYTYLWSPVGGTGPIASGLSAGTYTVTLTDGNGCTAAQTATLTNPSLITITAVPTNASCNSTPDGAIDITVTGGTPGYTYQWSGGSIATTQDVSGLLVGATTSYTITVTDTAGCIADTAIVLTSTIIITADAGNDTTFCQSGLIVLNASLSTNAINYQWFEIPSNTNVGNTVTVTVNPPPGVAYYYVIVDNGPGCIDSDTVVITSNPLPTVDPGADVTIISGKIATIGGSPTGTSGSTFLWSPSLGLDNITIPNPVASPTITTTYKVVVTSPDGCTAIDSIVVTVFPDIIFPNGISPNADGANDEWIIDGIELFPNCIVEVYNRWGELLFQSPGYKEKWDGTYKGKPLPVGTYYYIVNLNDPLYPDTYTGPITILR